MEWDSKTYDKDHDFVFKYGEGLLNLVPKTAECVLDVGCGTGELTAQLARTHKTVLGIDQSKNMVETAHQHFPSVRFQQENIVNPNHHLGTYDVVFSNAVFHWIQNQDALLTNVHHALNPNGLLVCEFGGYHNIAAITDAFGKILNTMGYDYQMPFYFPKASTYEKLLTTHGFKVKYIHDYDRPTVLKEGARGLEVWVRQFFAKDLARLTSQQQQAVFNQLNLDLKPKLWRGDHWEADYRRLRVVAKA